MTARRVLLLLAVVVLVAGALGLVGRSSSLAAVADPRQGVTRYSLTIDGVEIASFSELGGINTEIDEIEYLESSGESTLTGKRKPPTIVLKRGQTQDLSLWAWHELAVEDIRAAGRSASLVMYNSEGTPVARYHLEKAWPSRIEIGALKAGASEVLIETITMVCEQIQRVAV